MMGGSYGGYMANWIAGHTDRFKAIVSHAWLWAMDQMLATTDVPQLFPASSPTRWTARLLGELTAPARGEDHDADAGDPRRPRLPRPDRRGTAPVVGPEAHQDRQFLYFPDENHWVLSPGNVKAWYHTVHAFLAEHVLGEDWRRPDLL